jgi:thiol-disulfide isomerase/thioredoxin
MQRMFHFCVGISLTFALSTTQASPDEPFFKGGFKEACADATKTKRLVLVDFYTTWCMPCKKLDQTTWKDKEVLAWLKDTCVSIKLDAEKEESLAKQYKLNAYPTILLLKADGTEIDRFVGYKTPAELLSETKDALAGKDAVARAKDKLAGKNANKPLLRKGYADALAQKGRYEEALKEYVWCLDEGAKHDPGFIGARAFVFMNLNALARNYEPALKLLVGRHDAARGEIIKGTAGEEVIPDFVAINQNRGNPDETLKLYDELRAKKSPAAPKLFVYVEEQLLAQRRYTTMVEGGGEFSERVAARIAGLKFANAPGGVEDPELKELLKAYLVNSAGRYFEALAGADRLAAADALRDQILAFDRSTETYKTLLRHARRAEKEKVVQALLSSAKSALSAAEYKQVHEAK